jgi:hypothetical protein
MTISLSAGQVFWLGFGAGSIVGVLVLCAVAVFISSKAKEKK